MENKYFNEKQWDKILFDLTNDLDTKQIEKLDYFVKTLIMKIRKLEKDIKFGIEQMYREEKEEKTNGKKNY